MRSASGNPACSVAAISASISVSSAATASGEAAAMRPLAQRPMMVGVLPFLLLPASGRPLGTQEFPEARYGHLIAELSRAFRLDRDPLYLFERDLITGAVVKLGRPWAFVRRHRLGVLERAAGPEVGCDSRGAEGVAADPPLHAEVGLAALDHAPGVDAVHRGFGKRAGAARGGAEEGGLFLLADPGSVDVGSFLGGNDLDDPGRPAGVLTYSFDKRLIEILQDSRVWGKINVPVLMAFMSKYSVSLYENIAQMVNLERKQSHTYSLAEFRELMGVQDGQYKTFGEFNKHVLKPAVLEINALAAFTIGVLPVKQGKRVEQIMVTWMHKDADALQAAMKEVESTKVGRKARISGTAETIAPPMQSIERLMRADRLQRSAARIPQKLHS
jgi:Initiator Replication protein